MLDAPQEASEQCQNLTEVPITAPMVDDVVPVLSTPRPLVTLKARYPNMPAYVTLLLPQILKS